MSELRQHLSPQEVARRQRWVVVGVSILGMLFVATWLFGLPSRLKTLAGNGTMTESLLGEIPKTNYINADEFLYSAEDTARTAALIKQVTTLEAQAQAQPVAAPAISNQTIEILKKKLK